MRDSLLLNVVYIDENSLKDTVREAIEKFVNDPPCLIDALPIEHVDKYFEMFFNQKQLRQVTPVEVATLSVVFSFMPDLGPFGFRNYACFQLFPGGRFAKRGSVYFDFERKCSATAAFAKTLQPQLRTFAEDEPSFDWSGLEVDEQLGFIEAAVGNFGILRLFETPVVSLVTRL